MYSSNRLSMPTWWCQPGISCGPQPRRLRLLTTAEEQVLNAAFEAYYFSMAGVSVRHAYRHYRWASFCANHAFISERTFYRRLRRWSSSAAHLVMRKHHYLPLKKRDSTALKAGDLEGA